MDNYPKSITKECTKIIYNQMNNSFYEIQGKDSKFGVGIFCKIRIKNKNILVLMTNYQLLDEEYIENNLGINIKIDNTLNFIKFGNKRICYINKDYNLSIIEIKENIKFTINFLEIDETLYEKHSPILYNKETIYIIHHNEKNQISVSYSIMAYINKFNLNSFGNIKSNKAISPIFNLKNNKIIGIYMNNSKYFIKGLYFKLIIDRFNKIINMHKNIFNVKNEIDILIKIYKEDINRKIYFLNNIDREHIEDRYLTKSYSNDKFSRLNEENTELYINERLCKCKNYFEPDKEGEYKIKLIFYINLEDCSYMFSGCENILKLDFISFNTFFVKKMNYMFCRCINLKEINLLSFDTTNELYVF